jgi:3-methyladenine DNA glycosylase AlkD
MTSNDIFQSTQEWCVQQANPAAASAMKAYMKNHFDFYGINAPSRKVFVSKLKKEWGKSIIPSLPELSILLWQENHRESQYIAVDLWAAYIKHYGPDMLPTLEAMILTKSWWDTVDGIAPALVGNILKRYPETRKAYIYKWAESPNIWLQRSAIIFQLKYGKDTDWDLLCETILLHDQSKEFFVRKAQGWALRQYSRYAPEKVHQFIEVNPQLSGLTKKEALKLIGK